MSWTTCFRWRIPFACSCLLLAGLDSARAQQQEATVEALAQILSAEDSRAHESPVLRAAARHPEAVVRRHAALALGRVGEQSALPVLLELLVDPDSTVQAEAAFSLGLLADSTALPRLRQIIFDPPNGTAPAAQAEAVGAVARISGIGAVQIFSELLSRTTPRATGAELPITLRRALGESWRLGPATPVSRLVPFTASLDPDARRRAVYSIARLHGRGAPDALLAASDDSLSSIRAIAARELGRSFADSARIDAKGLSIRVRRLTDDPDPQVRIAALRALGSYRNPALAGAAVGHVADRDPNVRVQALATLGELGGVEALATLKAGTAEGAFAQRRQALLSLVAASPAEGFQVALVFLSQADWRLEAAALEALGSVHSDSASSVLARVLDVADGRVAAAAYAALEKTDSVRALSLAPTLIRHADPVVRSLAASLMGTQGDSRSVPSLVDAYGSSLADPTADARIAIITAAGQIASHDPRGPAATAEAFAKRYPTAGDYLVRRAAEEAFPSLAVRWGPPFPVNTGLGMGDYRDIARRLVWPAEHDGIHPGMLIETDRGTVGITLLAEDAPLTIAALLRLVARRYFDGGAWHRVVPGFVAQDGDPRGDGGGGPGFSLRDEVSRDPFEAGTVAVALDGPDTGGSQFFITLAPQPHLEGVYTVFGRVDSGMDVLSLMVQGDRIRRIRNR